MLFGEIAAAFAAALKEHPEWKDYPVHVSAMQCYTQGVKKIRIFLVEKVFQDGSIVHPETTDLLTSEEVVPLETPIVTIEI